MTTSTPRARSQDIPAEGLPPGTIVVKQVRSGPIQAKFPDKWPWKPATVCTSRRQLSMTPEQTQALIGALAQAKALQELWTQERCNG